MLILTRKPGESVYIGDNVKITIVEIKGHQIRLGIDAPRELRIYREEIYLQILEENREAAAAQTDEAGLEGLSAAWGERKGKPPKVGKLSGAKVTPSKDKDDEGGKKRGPTVIKRRKKKSE